MPKKQKTGKEDNGSKGKDKSGGAPDLEGMKLVGKSVRTGS